MFYITIIIIANHLFLAFLLLFLPRLRNSANTLLAGQLLWISLVHANGLVTLWYNASLYAHFFGFEYAVGLLMGPLIYLYTTIYLKGSLPRGLRLWVHFIPSALMAIFFTYIHLTNHELRFVFLGFTTKKYHYLISFLDSLSFIQIVGYLTCSIWIYVKARRSDVPLLRSQVKWLGFYFRSTVLLALVGIPMGLIKNGFWVGTFIPLATLAYYYLLTWKILQDVPFPVRITPNVVSQNIKDQTLTYIREHKPYLNPDLTLIDLSAQLHISRNQLSSLINNELGVNFYELINTYRIEEVKQKLLDSAYKNFTIDAIARDSGFNSRASFYESFKRETGMSPTEFRFKMSLSEN